MSHNNQSLADTLRDQLGKRIETNMNQLVKTPNDRIAGRIEALQEVLAFIDGEIAELNNPRPHGKT